MKMFGIAADEPGRARSVMRDLVAELARRGLRVSTIHEAPDDFEPDLPGKDSYEHRHAGASEVFLASDVLTALFHEEKQGGDVTPALLAARMARVDLVLVEGFAAFPHPKARIGRAQVDIKALADLVLAQASEAA
jgi:molybdopterin-guanine dinucleotide biosynthesis protein B